MPWTPLPPPLPETAVPPGELANNAVPELLAPTDSAVLFVLLLMRTDVVLAPWLRLPNRTGSPSAAFAAGAFTTAATAAAATAPAAPASSWRRDRMIVNVEPADMTIILTCGSDIDTCD